MIVWPSPAGSRRNTGASMAVLPISSTTRPNSMTLWRNLGGRRSGTRL